MFAILKNISVFFVVFCILMLIGCKHPNELSKQSSQVSSEQKPPVQTLEVKNFTSKQYEIYNNLLYKTPNWRDQEVLKLVGHPFFYAYYASKYISPSGLKAVPVIITAINDNDAEPIDSFEKYYWANGLYMILHINPFEGENPAIDTADAICSFYRYSKTQVPKIILSDIAIDQKILELRKFGIYAVPYVIEQMENGNTKYEWFFTAIGLHLNDDIFGELAALKYCFSDDMHLQADYLDNADKFDYKVWLRENQEDLNALFEFIDAFCVEYEAEMKNN